MANDSGIRYGAELRILIVGGGIAGLMLADLLIARGCRPEIIEKSPEYGGVGYVIGLWPAGSNVLKGAGLYPEFRERSQPFERYSVVDGRGDVVKSYGFDALDARFGPACLLQRADLIDILRHGLSNAHVRFSTTVASLIEREDGVEVTTSDGTRATYDLVVGADGLRSQVRTLLFGETPLAYHGFTGWAFWIAAGLLKPGDVLEYWAGDRFFGIYPGKDALCCFIAKSAPPNQPDPVETRAERLRADFGGLGGHVPAILRALPDGHQIWHDDFNDVKLRRWHTRRVVLIGDAGAAMLPTGGVGASMAMESAAALADVLDRADSARVELALQEFVRRRRKRVDRVQSESRWLGRLMLLNRPSLTAPRNLLVRAISARRMVDYMGEMLGASS